MSESLERKSSIVRREPELPPPSSIKLAVVDDDASMVATLKAFLVDLIGFGWAGSWTQSVEFLGAIPNLDTDVVLLDIDMPKVDGIDCVTQIREFQPDTAILMFTVVDDDKKILAAMLNGANGYILKGASAEAICRSIQEIVAGGAPMTPSIARRIVDHMRLQPKKGPAHELPQPDGPETKLTPKQIQALELLAEGLTYLEIAQEMGISLDTVRKHVSEIYNRLGVRNRTQAANEWSRSRPQR